MRAQMMDFELIRGGHIVVWWRRSRRHRALMEVFRCLNVGLRGVYELPLRASTGVYRGEFSILGVKYTSQCLSQWATAAKCRCFEAPAGVLWTTLGPPTSLRHPLRAHIYQSWDIISQPSHSHTWIPPNFGPHSVKPSRILPSIPHGRLGRPGGE